MRKLKESLAVSLVFAMIMSSVLLTGCGSEKKASGESKSSTSTTNPNDTGKPKVPVTLKMLGQTDKFDPLVDVERARIKETLGYDIVGELGSTADRINLILASGEDYDIIKFGARDKALLSSLIKNKAVRSLSESIDKYGPNLKAAFGNEVWAMGSNEGKIYALFNTNYEAVVEGIALRQDWMKKLNLSMPTNTDELYNVLKAFKEKDPGAIGTKNVIPLSMNFEDYGTFELNGLTQAFGLGRGLESYVEKNGKLVLSIELPGAKDYVAYLKKLYNEGLLDADFVNNKWANFDQKLGAGNVGGAIMSCWFSVGQGALMKKDPQSKFVFTETIKSKDGTQKIQKTGGAETIVVVPNASKKVDDVVKFANAFLDQKNYSKLVIGDENVHYKKEGTKLVPTELFSKELNLARWFFPVNEGKMYTKIFEVRANKNPEMGAMWDDVRAKNDKNGYIDPLAFAPSLPEVIKNAKVLNEYLKEKLIKIIIDSRIDINEFDNIVKEYKAKGGDEVTKANNEWYSTLKKK